MALQARNVSGTFGKETPGLSLVLSFAWDKMKKKSEQQNVIYFSVLYILILSCRLHKLAHISS